MSTSGASTSSCPQGLPESTDTEVKKSCGSLLRFAPENAYQTAPEPPSRQVEPAAALIWHKPGLAQTEMEPSSRESLVNEELTFDARSHPTKRFPQVEAIPNELRLNVGSVHPRKVVGTANVQGSLNGVLTVLIDRFQLAPKDDYACSILEPICYNC